MRYARQMLVSEIGERGQHRLEAATAELAGAGLAHDVAEAYARRAGIGVVVPGAIDPALAPSFLESEAARAVVAGSRSALAAIRSAVFKEAAEEPR